MSQQLLAGIGRTIITPPVGIGMAGYNARIDPSVGVESVLTATAVVFSDGISLIPIIAIDTLMFLSPTANRVRSRIADCLEIPVDQVLLNYSHTHSGPLIPDWLEIHPEQKTLQESYQANLENLLVGCVKTAKVNLRPVRITAGSGQVKIGINRREWYKGRLIIGENPEGITDPAVEVIRVDNLDGSPLVVLFKYACHPCTMGPHSLFLSPDYPGVARRMVEKITGVEAAVFLQGTAGNVNPITGIGAGPLQSDIEQMTRLGGMLGSEVIKVFYSLRTNTRRGERRFWESISIQSHWPFESIQDYQPQTLAVRTIKLSLPLQRLPDMKSAKASAKAFRIRLDASRSSGAPKGKIEVDSLLCKWADGVVEEVAKGDQERKVEMFVQAIRIGDVALVGVPGEPFSELGLEVKQKSPFANTIFLGYTNGWLGYFPTAEAFPVDGKFDFETYRIPDLLYQNALLPAPPTPFWPEAIVSTSIDLLKGLITSPKE
jgi:neutral ceramidase